MVTDPVVFRWCVVPDCTLEAMLFTKQADKNPSTYLPFGRHLGRQIVEVDEYADYSGSKSLHTWTAELSRPLGIYQLLLGRTVHVIISL